MRLSEKPRRGRLTFALSLAATLVAASRCTAVVCFVPLLPSSPAWAEEIESPAARGRAIAEEKCSRCHAIGPAGESPLALAPPFRDVVKRYAVEQLAEALAEGIVTGHKEMPVFIFQPNEIDALLAYLQDLEPRAKGGGG